VNEWVRRECDLEFGPAQDEEATSRGSAMQVLWHGRRIEAEQDRTGPQAGYRGSTAIRHPLHRRRRLIARISGVKL
jgi:hypothetical protein